MIYYYSTLLCILTMEIIPFVQMGKLIRKDMPNKSEIESPAFTPMRI